MIRQPIHTVYGGAHLFRHNVAWKLGRIALEAFINHRELLGVPVAIERRGIEKLKADPVEDQRIDFEDGYGYRADDEEDQHAAAAGEQLARGMAEATLPPFIGIRVKPFSAEAFPRAVRTLDIVIATLAARTGGALPAHFVVTLPKVAMPEQVAALA